MRQYSSLSSQSGVALITVLLFLILIMVVGAIAVRQASVDLNVAASDQVGTLLLNNSDSVLAYVETVASKPNQSNKQYTDMMSQEYGVFGYFLVGGNKVNHQISLCYRPNESKLFDRTNRAQTREPGDNTILKNRACNASSAGDYTSDRTSAMTQMIIKGLKDEFSDDFNQADLGTSEGGQGGNIAPKVQINSVSVLPAMSNKSSDAIQNCLARPVGDAKNDFGIDDGNVNDCLRDNNIPSIFVVEEGFIKDEEKGGFTGVEVNNPCQDDELCKAALTNP